MKDDELNEAKTLLEELSQELSEATKRQKRADSESTQKRDESIATGLQTEVLLKCITLRIGLRDNPNKIEFKSVKTEMNGIEQLIKEKNIPSAVKNDLIADFNAKKGFLLYLCSFSPPGQPEASRNKALKEAEACLRDALELKKNWDPAQIYLVQVLQAQARFDEAESCLQEILGAEPQGQQKVVADGVPPQEAGADRESHKPEL
jgi:tetratricopeptide (TPR) repeat protein